MKISLPLRNSVKRQEHTRVGNDSIQTAVMFLNFFCKRSVAFYIRGNALYECNSIRVFGL